MGQRQSSTTNRSMDDRTFGTGSNAVQLEDVFVEAQKVPAKYFGGQAIENDTSIHQMQRDLLSFDQALKRLFCFGRKKRKPSMDYEDEYYESDGNPQTIPEEDEEEEENRSPSHYINVKRLEMIDIAPSFGSTWRCRYCTAENRASDIDCRECRQTETRF